MSRPSSAAPRSKGSAPQRVDDGFSKLKSMLSTTGDQVRYLSHQTPATQLRGARVHDESVGSAPAAMLRDRRQQRPDIEQQLSESLNQSKLTMQRMRTVGGVEEAAAAAFTQASQFISLTKSKAAAESVDDFSIFSARDSAQLGLKMASSSSLRVNRALHRAGFEPPLPVLGVTGNVTVYEPRLPLILDEAPRLRLPLGSMGFVRPEAMRPQSASSPSRALAPDCSDPILPPALRPALVYDAGQPLSQQGIVGLIVLDGRHRQLVVRAEPVSVGPQGVQPIRAEDYLGGAGGTEGGRERRMQGGEEEGDEEASTAPPKTDLPFNATLTDRLMAHVHPPRTTTAAHVAIHPNPIFQIARGGAHTTGGGVGRGDDSGFGKDGNGGDREATVLANRAAYASAGLRPPLTYTPGANMRDCGAMLVALAEEAATGMPPAASPTSKKFGAEMAYIDAALEARGSVISHVLRPGLQKLRPQHLQAAGVLPAYLQAAESGRPASALPALPAAISAQVRAERTNNLWQLKRSVIAGSKPVHTAVTSNGQVKVGSLRLDPSQAAALSSLRRDDPGTATVFACLLQHGKREERRIASAAAAFDASMQDEKEHLHTALEQFNYRVHSRHSAKVAGLEDVLTLHGGKAEAEAAMEGWGRGAVRDGTGTRQALDGGGVGRAVQGKGAAKARVMDDEDAEALARKMRLAAARPVADLTGPRASISVNLGPIPEAMTTVRSHASREALLHLNDSHSAILESVRTLAVSRPGGLDEVDRAWVRILRQAVATDVHANAPWMRTSLSHLHRDVMALPDDVLPVDIVGDPVRGLGLGPKHMYAQQAAAAAKAGVKSAPRPPVTFGQPGLGLSASDWHGSDPGLRSEAAAACEPSASVAPPLLTDRETLARIARRCWPLFLGETIDVMMRFVKLSEGEYTGWLAACGLALPSRESIQLVQAWHVDTALTKLDGTDKDRLNV